MRIRPELSSSISLLALPLLLPAGGSAQLAPIGLSEVRAQWFDNEPLGAHQPSSDDRFAGALATGDFNGDGASDLATGIPRDDDAAAGCLDCGMVVVRWGVPGSGLVPGVVPVLLHQALPESPDPPASEERFGFALAAGDFNGDGYDDLAVGIPGFGFEQLGAVQIYYGAATGFQTEHSEYFTEADAGGGGNVCVEARFGFSLTVGNFDHDAYDDLVIGASQGCEGAGDEAVRGGSVYVGHGQEWGIQPWYGYRISQDEVDMQDTVEAGDLFGTAIAAGDLDPDSYDDLAIGVPGEDDTGMIQILFGSQWGLLFATNVIWLPGALGEVPEVGDRLGRALAVGDFDGNFYDDLAIGDPMEDLGPANEKPDAGAIAVAFGTSSGMDLSRTLRFTQGSLYGNDVYDLAFDNFGWSLATGDFDSDGLDDLAVGHPGDDGAGPDSGAVSVLMGAFGDDLGARNRMLRPGIAGIGLSQAGQLFGDQLAVGDFDGGGYADLAIGSPWFDSGSLTSSGAELVLYGAHFADGFEVGTTSRWSSVSP